MGSSKASTRPSPAEQLSPQVLICVDTDSLGFLRSNPVFPRGESVEVLRSSDEVFERLWHSPDRVSTIVLDSCDFDLEELFYASLNHTHVSFVVRSPSLADDMRRRLSRRPNVALPCTDFMVWTYAFSLELIRIRPNPD